MARLNMARSRVRPSTCSLVRIAQTCFVRNGGLAPSNLHLFHGARLAPSSIAISSFCMVVLLYKRGRPACAVSLRSASSCLLSDDPSRAVGTQVGQGVAV